MSYPGRSRLDAADARLRRGLTRLARASTRNPDDPQLAAALAPLVDAAVAKLDEITDLAHRAEADAVRDLAKALGRTP